jgi:hypothetical protein
MMRSFLSIGVLAVALVAVLALGLTVGADAKPRAHVGSSVTLESAGPDGLSGKVSAGGKGCRAQRQVAIYRVNSGASVPSSEFLTSTWTRGDGSWALTGPQYPGQYWAEVQRKTVPKAKGGRALICRSAVSGGATWG